MYTDAHCHLAHPDWGRDLDAALAAAQTAGISHWIAGGIHPDEWELQKQIARQHSLSLVFGLHPWWVAKATADEITQGLANLTKQMPQIVAVGELGLDHHFFTGEAELQKQAAAFSAQLKLAARAQKPVIIHAVKAHSECLERLRANAGKWRGLVHRFHGSLAEAQGYLELGLTLSVGGPGLERKAKNSETLWRSIPASHLVLETDAPWDKRFGVALPDQLAALTQIAEVVAKARGESKQALLGQSTENLKNLFRV